MQSIDALVAQIEGRIKANKSDLDWLHSTRAVSICSLLRGLKDFAQKQFEFLYKGFDPENGLLEPSTTLRGDSALNIILDQVRFDLFLIQTIWGQRMQAQHDPHMKRTFAVADALAMRALQPAIDRNLVLQSTALVYVQKMPNVRIIPYAPIAVVGIPYSAIDAYANGSKPMAAVDLLAIPHEVGHYVFRHGIFEKHRLTTMLRDGLDGRPEWLNRWHEELFSDVYGTIVAGPAIAQDFQDMSMLPIGSEFFEDDDEHPIPALRPYVYTETLKLLHKEVKTLNLDDAALDLEKLWKVYVKSRGGTRDKERMAIVKQILDGMVTRVLGDSADLSKIWTDGTVEIGMPLYERFAEWVASLDEAVPDAVPIVNDAPTVETDLPASMVFNWKIGWINNRVGQWVNHIREFALKSADKKIGLPPEVWVPIVHANGWAIGLPNETDEPYIG